MKDIYALRTGVQHHDEMIHTLIGLEDEIISARICTNGLLYISFLGLAQFFVCLRLCECSKLRKSWYSATWRWDTCHARHTLTIQYSATSTLNVDLDWLFSASNNVVRYKISIKSMWFIPLILQHMYIHLLLKSVALNKRCVTQRTGETGFIIDNRHHNVNTIA